MAVRRFLIPGLTATLALLWLAAVGFGFFLLERFAAQAGEAALPPTAWPAAMPFARDAERFTLVLAAHPQCPCTRATLGELDRLLARCGTRVRAHVLFYTDPANGLDDAWAHGDLWDAAARIPDVAVRTDPAGDLARALGCRTSGDVLLFAPDGRLAFAGGITPARGHAGDSAGSDAIAALALGSVAVPDHPMHSEVYGCSLGLDGTAPGTTP